MPNEQSSASSRSLQTNSKKRKSDSVDESRVGPPDLETPCIACLNAMAVIPGTLCRKYGSSMNCLACNNAHQACNRELTTADGQLRTRALDLAKLSHNVSLGQPVPSNYRQVADEYIALRKRANVTTSRRPSAAPMSETAQIVQALNTHNYLAANIRALLGRIVSELAAVRDHLGIPDPSSLQGREEQSASAPTPTRASSTAIDPVPAATPRAASAAGARFAPAVSLPAAEPPANRSASVPISMPSSSTGASQPGLVQVRKKARIQSETETLVNVTSTHEGLEENSENGAGNDTLVDGDEISTQACSEVRSPTLDFQCRTFSGGSSIQIRMHGFAPDKK